MITAAETVKTKDDKATTANTPAESGKTKDDKAPTSNAPAVTVKTKDDKATTAGKPGRKPKVEETPSERYFVGELKDGIPVIQKEVSLSEAYDDFRRTDRPFMSLTLWKIKSEMIGEEQHTVKTPA
jgi:hypothetical protein